MNKIIHVPKNKINKDNLTELVQCIRNDGIIVFPTDTVYGIGCNAFCTPAINRIYRIKGRSYRKPLILLISEFRQAQCFITEVPKITGKLTKKFWPGALTLIFKCSTLGTILTGGKHTIGIRIPSHNLLLELIIRCGVPLASTSANLTHHPAISKVSELSVKIKNQVDLIVDAGITQHQQASTVLDLSHFPYTIVRKGVVDPLVLNRMLS